MNPPKRETPRLRACLLLALAAPLLASAQEGAVLIEADSLSEQAGAAHAAGNVKARWGEVELCAAEIFYDRNTGLVRALGDVKLTRRGDVAQGDAAQFDFGQDSGNLRNFETDLAERGLRAAGASAQWNGSEMSAEDVRISSCPRDSEDWRLEAGHVQILNDDHQFIARDTVMKIGDVPVFYLPYGRFYYGQERHSGFLWPQFRFGSGSGAGFSAPYYLALAPNADATITPNYRNRHGLELGGEFRFLTRKTSGEAFVGSALFDDSGRGREQLEARYADGPWQVELKAHNVSDDDYLRDYADSDSQSLRHLPRSIGAAYQRGHFKAGAFAEHHKTLGDTISPPYIAPRLEAGYFDGDSHADWSARVELTRFRHKLYRDWDTLRQVALLDARGYARLGEVAITPQAGIHAARYSAVQSNPHVKNGAFWVPHAKVEASRTRRKLFGERDDYLRLRAALAYAPARPRQNDLPHIDTSLREANTENLFHWNRFAGNDRAGDAKFLAYSAGYNWHAGPREVLHLSAAQRYHLSDAVSLGEYHYAGANVASRDFDSPPQQGFGNVLIDARARFDDTWSGAGNAEWDSDKKSIARFYLETRGVFLPNKRVYARYLNDGGESLIAGAAWPLAGWLEAAVKVDYLLDDDKFARSDAALRMRDSCDCWTIYAGISDQVIDEGDNDLQLSFGLEFTGLGHVGGDYDQFLANL